MGRPGSTGTSQSVCRLPPFSGTRLPSESRQSRTAGRGHTDHLSAPERICLPHDRNSARIQACFDNPRFSLCRNVVVAACIHETTGTPCACLCVEPRGAHFVCDVWSFLSARHPHALGGLV